jgi:hypothetical protein
MNTKNPAPKRKDAPALTEELSNAYFGTEFQVFIPNGTITLHGLGLSEELVELHLAYEVSSSAFITAYSPYSQEIEDWVNRENQARLMREASRNWHFLPGAGADPKGNWPAEPSILVLGIEPEEAMAIGREFHQHAVLIGDAEGNTELRACWPEDQAMLIHPMERMVRNLTRELEESGMPVTELPPSSDPTRYHVTFIPARRGKKNV